MKYTKDELGVAELDGQFAVVTEDCVVESGFETEAEAEAWIESHEEN